MLCMFIFCTDSSRCAQRDLCLRLDLCAQRNFCLGLTLWPCRSKRERFLQFSWRHRPDSLLTPDQEAQIQKDFKRYSKKYQEEDELIHTQVSKLVAS